MSKSHKLMMKGERRRIVGRRYSKKGSTVIREETPAIKKAKERMILYSVLMVFGR